MDDAQLVSLRERATDLAEHLDRLRRREASDAVEALAEVLADEDLHRDERDALPDRVIDDLHDVRATQGRRGLGLALEARLHLGHVSVVAFDELDCAFSVERGLPGEPYRPHASLPQLLDELEPTRDDDVLS